jgi:hypothetical protein
MMALVAVALFLGVAGCAGGSSGAGNEQSAREALGSALEAWKNGRTADDMRRGTPEVVVGDSAWKLGLKLSGYEIGKGMYDGKNLRVPVTLTLVQPPRGTRKIDVNYIVGTSPVVTIFRDSD